MVFFKAENNSISFHSFLQAAVEGPPSTRPGAAVGTGISFLPGDPASPALRFPVLEQRARRDYYRITV